MAAKRVGLKRARNAAGYSQEDFALMAGVTPETVRNWESGRSEPIAYKRPRIMRVLDITRDQLESYLRESDHDFVEPLPAASILRSGNASFEDDEASALELANRIEASDVSETTLLQLENIVDDLAIAYTASSPLELSVKIRGYIDYVARLLGARKNLDQHRRLLTVGGWLSLLSATVNIDLDRAPAAQARLRTADSIARQTGHDEIRAWGYETRAWWLLTDGNYAGALDYSRQAQGFAPRGSSIEIQASAQEGRALARLGDFRDMYGVLERVNKLVSPLKIPDRPEHHYRYDPNKSVAYMATTLAWAGDPAAESFAREIISRLAKSARDGKWPRRVASANLDLALALIATDRTDEAVGATHSALSSGRVVPSNFWRAAEVIRAVEARKMPEAVDLRDAYEEMQRSGSTR